VVRGSVSLTIWFSTEAAQSAALRAISDAAAHGSKTPLTGARQRQGPVRNVQYQSSWRAFAWVVRHSPDMVRAVAIS